MTGSSRPSGTVSAMTPVLGHACPPARRPAAPCPPRRAVRLLGSAYSPHAAAPTAAASPTRPVTGQSGTAVPARRLPRRGRRPDPGLVGDPAEEVPGGDRPLHGRAGLRLRAAAGRQHHLDQRRRGARIVKFNTPPSFPDLPPDRFAARFGYGISTAPPTDRGGPPVDPNDKIVAAMSVAERVAYQHALYGAATPLDSQGYLPSTINGSPQACTDRASRAPADRRPAGGTRAPGAAGAHRLPEPPLASRRPERPGAGGSPG